MVSTGQPCYTSYLSTSYSGESIGKHAHMAHDDFKELSVQKSVYPICADVQDWIRN